MEALDKQVPFVGSTVNELGSTCALDSWAIKRKKVKSSSLLLVKVFQLKKIFFILVMLQLFCGVIKMMVRDLIWGFEVSFFGDVFRIIYWL